MRSVSVSMLQPDMALAKSIYHNDRLLLREGQQNLALYANQLKRLGINFLYIVDNKSSDIEIPDAISEQTRVACKHMVYQMMADFTNQVTIDVTKYSDTITDLIDEILANPDVQISLNDLGAADEYTLNHSVSTTVYSLLLARRLNYSRPMLEKLAAGTLLHDIGKTLIDKSILLKEGPLTKEEFESIKRHTVLGYDALKSCVNLSELSKIISLYHHERMDASGYPTGVPAGTLHEFVRIVSIADVYDALTSDRCYRKKWSNLEATNQLIKLADTQLDIKLVTDFIQQIAVYPNGSLVRLSNNWVGIIKEQNHHMPLRPVVRLIADNVGNPIDMYEVDLMKEFSVTILESEIE